MCPSFNDDVLAQETQGNFTVKLIQLMLFYMTWNYTTRVKLRHPLHSVLITHDQQGFITTGHQTQFYVFMPFFVCFTIKPEQQAFPGTYFHCQKLFLFFLLTLIVLATFSTFVLLLLLLFLIIKY